MPACSRVPAPRPASRPPWAPRRTPRHTPGLCPSGSCHPRGRRGAWSPSRGAPSSARPGAPWPPAGATAEVSPAQSRGHPAQSAEAHRRRAAPPGFVALALALAGAWSPAAHAATCALDGRPATVDTLLEAALAARARDDASTSLACLSRAYTLEPSSGLLHNIARLFEDLGRYREAAEAYRRLVRDPTLDPALATADKARLEALSPKLARAWLAARLLPDDELRVDGQRVPPGEEHGVDARSVSVEIRRGARAYVLRVELTVGARRELRVPDAATSAVVVLAPRTQTFALDERPLSTPLEGLRELVLPPGSYTLAWADDGGEQRRAVALTAGETWVATDGGRAPLGQATPWVAAATAVGLGAAGAVFWGLAEDDRQTIAGAARDADGVVVGLTLAEADRLDARAQDRTTVAVGLAIGAGVAAAFAATLWWLGAGD